MSDESPDGKKHGHGAGAREKRLRALPHWPEIEVRLQHGWTPDRVTDWHGRTYPGEAVPPRRTLYRFLEDQAPSWLVPRIVIEQLDTRHVPRILVVEKQAQLIETQLLRLNKGLQKEVGMDGYLDRELRAEIELADRLLHRHFVTQQDVGLEPKVTHGGKGDGVGADNRNDAEAREVSTLVHRIVELPSDQWLEAVVQILGPPPIKQPLKLDGEVIEMEPLKSDDVTPGGP